MTLLFISSVIWYDKVMTFEKIEEAYQLLLENCQLIENDLKTHIYDAIVEQNSFLFRG